MAKGSAVVAYRCNDYIIEAAPVRKPAMKETQEKVKASK